ncbi:MAG: hypothetical protein ABIK28_21865 [Planctomycetota bacterium]
MMGCKLYVAVSLLIVLIIGVSACSGVRRGSDDASLDEMAMSRKLDLKDVDLTLKKMMDEFRNSGFLQRVQQSGARPGLALDLILNETDQHISTDRLLESFQGMIVDIGAFKVVSPESVAKLKATMLEQNTDWYNGGTVSNAGSLFGFRYIIGGKLFGETERLSGDARTQYRLVLKCVDVETSEILWQKTADVTKYQD